MAKAMYFLLKLTLFFFYIFYSFASILAYKIPREDVQSLALVFSKLEEGKELIF